MICRSNMRLYILQRGKSRILEKTKPVVSMIHTFGAPGELCHSLVDPLVQAANIVREQLALGRVQLVQDACGMVRSCFIGQRSQQTGKTPTIRNPMQYQVVQF